jgi:hypothetical protein
MRKGLALITISALALLLLGSTSLVPEASMQSERTLVGEWMVTSSPINDEIISRMGNSLGFPNRHMVFEQQGELRTAFVAREDVGVDVEPLGVWRINGDRFSATFQLWCPDSSRACGSVIMRGEFARDDRIRGTMTVFFDQEDQTRPTGYDTWTFSFRGDRIAGGAN